MTDRKNIRMSLFISWVTHDVLLSSGFRAWIKENRNEEPDYLFVGRHASHTTDWP